MTNDNELLTLAQAAQEVGLAHSTLRNYTLGKLLPPLPATTIGRAKVVTRAALVAWNEQRLATPPKKRGRRKL